MNSSAGPGRSSHGPAGARDTGRGGGLLAATRTRVLLELLLSSPGIEQYLDEVARMAADVSDDIAGCGVTVRRGGDVLTVAGSNELAVAVDEAQYRQGTGPCLDCLGDGRIHAVGDMVDEDRWGSFPSHAIGHGVRSSLSVPLDVDGRTVGVLNAYGSRPDLFTGEVREELVEFAGQTQASLAVALRSAEQADRVDQLYSAMQSRSVIDQALGIVMARQRCTAREAFAVLRAASQSGNRKISDIAAAIITATTGHEPESGRFET